MFAVLRKVFSQGDPGIAQQRLGFGAVGRVECHADAALQWQAHTAALIDARAVFKQALGDAGSIASFFNAIQQDDIFVMVDLVDDVLVAQGFHQTIFEQGTELLGKLIAEGFLDFTVTVDFEDQATGLFITGAGMLQYGLHDLAQGLAQWQADNAWSRCTGGRQRPWCRFLREGNDAGVACGQMLVRLDGLLVERPCLPISLCSAHFGSPESVCGSARGRAAD